MSTPIPKDTLSFHVAGGTPPLPAGTVRARAMLAAERLVALRDIGLLRLESFPVGVLPYPGATVEALVMPAIRAAVKAGGLSTFTGTVELLTIGAGVEVAVPVGMMSALLPPLLTAMTGASSTLLAISSASSVNPPISSVMTHRVSYHATTCHEQLGGCREQHTIHDTGCLNLKHHILSLLRQPKLIGDHVQCA